MADESKQRLLLFNIGCKWRYKQMRYDEYNLKQTTKQREPLERRCKSLYKIELSSKYDLTDNNNTTTNDSKKSIASKNCVHGSINALADASGLLYCDWENCNQQFNSWFQLQRHRCKHNKNSVKPYECDWSGCHNKFKKLKNLIVHRRLHTGERPFKCEYENCNKTFRAAHSLTSHRRTHLQEKFINQIKH